MEMYRQYPPTADNVFYLWCDYKTGQIHSFAMERSNVITDENTLWVSYGSKKYVVGLRGDLKNYDHSLFLKIIKRDAEVVLRNSHSLSPDDLIYCNLNETIFTLKKKTDEGVNLAEVLAKKENNIIEFPSFRKKA